MQVNSKKDLNMDRENTTIMMGQCMMDSGFIIPNMDKENSHRMKLNSIRVNSKTGKNKEMESCILVKMKNMR